MEHCGILGAIIFCVWWAVHCGILSTMKSCVWWVVHGGISGAMTSCALCDIGSPDILCMMGSVLWDIGHHYVFCLLTSHISDLRIPWSGFGAGQSWESSSGHSVYLRLGNGQDGTPGLSCREFPRWDSAILRPWNALNETPHFSEAKDILAS